MSAAEYYNSGPAPINTNFPPSQTPPHPSSSPAPTHSTVSPINKPLPNQPTFPPTHGGIGYTDDFYGRHHSSQSIDVDTSYHPPAHSPSLSHNNSYSSDYDKQQPYNDGIPLHDTRPQQYQQPMSAAEAGMGMVGSNKHKRKSGLFSGNRRRPWFCWILSAVQISVFIAEIARNATLTGSPIMIKPQFNPMIGPSTEVLINMGARFVPCMKIIEGYTDTGADPLLFPCPSTTTSTSNCTLAQLCGFGGDAIPKGILGGNSSGSEPDQWWRFIVPIFLHAGVIHICFNMLFQLIIGVDMEREIGPIRFGLCYFASGIFGFVLGGNYAPLGAPSTGCSGSLYGILALLFLDLCWNWSNRQSPMKELLFLLLDVCLGFAIGLLPGLDNFSHIGGFIMGLILGIAVLHSPIGLRRKIGAGDPPYTPMTPAYMHGANTEGGSSATQGHSAPAFIKSPAGFFKGRKPLWWAFWIARAAALTLALILTIVLINNFYLYDKKCSWCKYINCLPVSNWCEMGDLTFTNTTTSRKMARGLASLLN